MSVRLRVSGEILCAAKSEPMPDDTYVPDGLHYELGVIQRVLIPDEDESTTGRWHWRRKGEPFRTLPQDAIAADPVNDFGRQVETGPLAGTTTAGLGAEPVAQPAV